MKIIILNCYSRNSLAVINALDKRYELIGGATARDNFKFGRPDRFFKSSRLNMIFRHADPKVDIAEFQNDIIQACNSYQADAILATGTTLSNSLSQIKNDILDKTKAKVLIEDYSKLFKLADK